MYCSLVVPVLKKRYVKEASAFNKFTYKLTTFKENCFRKYVPCCTNELVFDIQNIAAVIVCTFGMVLCAKKTHQAMPFPLKASLAQ